MTTICTTTTRTTDPLGYGERTVLGRLRHMAEDAVKEEAAILRARLAGKLGEAEKQSQGPINGDHGSVI